MSVGWTQFAHAGEVRLAWDPNPEPDLAGYKLHYGTASRNYGSVIDVGNVTTHTVGGLTEGVEYFFAVTAYNTAGLESGFSNEVSKLIPVTPPPNLCDVNQDGATNALDLQVMVNGVIGVAVCQGCDINQDGAANALDLQILVNVILGATPCP